MEEELKDIESNKTNKEKKSTKSTIKLLTKASILLFIAVLFVFKDKNVTFSQSTKYFYAASLIFLLASSVVGFYNLICIDKVKLKDNDATKGNNNANRKVKLLTFYNRDTLLQFSLLTYGLISTLILALKTICPFWPIC